MPEPILTAALAIPAIKRFEGCRLHAYPDPASGDDPWTIGYGSTGAGIVPGTIWTQEQAESDLAHRVSQIASDVCRMVTQPLPEASAAALVSFAYNLGEHALQESTLLHLVNLGRYQEAAAQFARWCRAAGKVNPGLVKRRDEERAMFLAGFDAPSGVAV